MGEASLDLEKQPLYKAVKDILGKSAVVLTREAYYMTLLGYCSRRCNKTYESGHIGECLFP